MMNSCVVTPPAGASAAWLDASAAASCAMADAGTSSGAMNAGSPTAGVGGPGDLEAAARTAGLRGGSGEGGRQRRAPGTVPSERARSDVPAAPRHPGRVREL